jgi:hypothetical protein
LHNIIAKITDSQGVISHSNIARVAVDLNNLALGKTVIPRPPLVAPGKDDATPNYFSRLRTSCGLPPVHLS